MRFCKHCRRTLSDECFPLRRKDGTPRHSYCRDCKAVMQRNWYARNRETHKKNVVAARNRFRKEARARNRAYVEILKQAPCAECSRHFPPQAMDFDHVRGRKVADVSRMMEKPFHQLVAEVAKCEVVCAACHRIRTKRRREKEGVT